MHKVRILLCFVRAWYQTILSIFFTINSPANRKSYHHPSAGGATLMNVGKFVMSKQYEVCTTVRWNNKKYAYYMYMYIQYECITFPAFSSA